MAKIDPQKVTIRRVDYTLLTRRMRKFDGLCDHPSVPKGEIWIRNSQVGVERLETLIHELLHAAFPDVAEWVVLEVAKDIAVILWDLGYSADWDE